MAHKPFHQWKLDANGRAKLDSKGKRILHPKAGQPKALKEYSDAERRNFDDAIEFDRSARRRSAQQVVEPIRAANELLGDN